MTVTNDTNRNMLSFFEYIDLGSQFHYKKYKQKLNHVEYYDGKWTQKLWVEHGQCCEHDLRKRIKILGKLVFSFCIIVFKMMKLLAILFIILSFPNDTRKVIYYKKVSIGFGIWHFKFSHSFLFRKKVLFTEK